MAREATLESLYELLGRREFAAWIKEQQQAEELVALRSSLQVLEQELAGREPRYTPIEAAGEKANGPKPSRR